MLIIKTDPDFRELNADLKKWERKLEANAEEFLKLAGQAFQRSARQGVLSGSMRGFGIDTGQTQAEGFKSVTHKRKKRTTKDFFSIYWLRVGNLFQNFKNRKKVRIVNKAALDYKRGGYAESIAEAMILKGVGE